MYLNPGTEDIQVQIYFYLLEKKRVRNLLLLTLRHEEMSLLGLHGFFITAENPLTQLHKYLGMLQIHTCLDINNEFTGEITALLNIAYSS